MHIILFEILNIKMTILYKSREFFGKSMEITVNKKIT